jgi:hypothetical protein
LILRGACQLIFGRCEESFAQPRNSRAIGDSRAALPDGSRLNIRCPPRAASGVGNAITHLCPPRDITHNFTQSLPTGCPVGAGARTRERGGANRRAKINGNFAYYFCGFDD